VMNTIVKWMIRELYKWCMREESKVIVFHTVVVVHFLTTEGNGLRSGSTI